MNGRVAVVGGGAAGFFAAIHCAEKAEGLEVVVLEKGPEFLQKVKISGGGRCNVTHACFEPRELVKSYPRGERELIGPYHTFQAEDTVWACFENDGRMFPITDSSRTVIDCLMQQARRAGVQLRANCGVTTIRKDGAAFVLDLSTGESLQCDRVLLATGGCRTPALGQLAVSLGHTLAPPVPSLFTFQIEVPWVRALAGVSVPLAELRVPGTKLQARGPLLFTHWGLSGPAVLRLSAWGARELHEKAYNFPLVVNWIPDKTPEELRSELMAHAKTHAAKLVSSSPLPPLPQRIWQSLVALTSVPNDRRWSSLTRAEQQSLIQTLGGTEFRVSGKSLNKDEFVTCGGVRLSEVNFKTMESKICPGLYFAGELLDIDGITGGFNFQAAWTTGWIAGRSIAGSFG